jgi:DNA-binding NarL/FixJ family response regulator
LSATFGRITDEQRAAAAAPLRQEGRGVVVAIGEPGLREHVTAAARRREALEVVGTAADAESMFALAQQPGVRAVACDLALASPAIWAHPTIAETGPCWLAIVPIGDLKTALDALCSGFDGAVEVEAGPEAVADALEALLSHDTVISPTIARTLIAGLRAAREHITTLRPVHSTLTGREWEILDLLRKHPEDTLRDFARALVVSEETVASHVKSIYRKLDVHSRAAALAAAQGLRHERGFDA